MAHLVETLAYANEAPWHRLGVKVDDTISPADMRIRAGLNWSIEKEPLITQLSGQPVPEQYALVRSTDQRVLGTCGRSYKPVQPEEVLNFFTDFVKEGGMKMDVAGSLSDGKHIFALASIQQSFRLGGKDEVGGYLLFSSPNICGKSLRIMFTPIRVVCNNTLTMALSDASGKGQFRLTHAREFVADEAKAALGIATSQLGEFEAQAQFLSSRKVKSTDTLQDYFSAIWPTKAQRVGSDAAFEGVMSNTASTAMEVFTLQPGAKYFPDSWWNAFNAVTYMVDHVVGSNDNNRLRNSWFGNGELLKRRALAMAVDLARLAA